MQKIVLLLAFGILGGLLARALSDVFGSAWILIAILGLAVATTRNSKSTGKES